MKTNLYRESKIIDIVNESSDTKTFLLEVPKNILFDIGQYILVKFTINDQIKNRAYSLSSLPKKYSDNTNVIAITIKIQPDGVTSNWLFENWKIGSIIEFMGPSGKFIKNELDTHKNLFLVAGGVGITPFKALIEYLIDHKMNNKITLLYCAQNLGTVLFKNFWTNKMNLDNIKIRFVLSREKQTIANAFSKRLDQNIIKQYYSNNQTPILFCGSSELYKKLIAILDELDIDKKLVHSELFGNETV